MKGCDKMKCSRCQKAKALDNEYDFCDECMKTFRPMVTELKLAYIHHYMHPEKKTIYVHDGKSKRYYTQLKSNLEIKGCE